MVIFVVVVVVFVFVQYYTNPLKHTEYGRVANKRNHIFLAMETTARMLPLPQQHLV